MRGARSALLAVSLCVTGKIAASGCGGPVSLGENSENWLDGNAIDSRTSRAPLTLYEGSAYPQNYAVDERTLYVVLRAIPTAEGASFRCDASNCPSTLRGLGAADPDRMTSDGRHLYWCTRSGPGELQRVARLRR